MARQLVNRQETDDFILTVKAAAEHHGHNVQNVIDVLYDEVMKRFAFDLDKIKVYERNGKTARTTWVTLDGNRYVFTYDYPEQKIKLLKGSTQGQLIESFDDGASQELITKTIGLL